MTTITQNVTVKIWATMYTTTCARGGNASTRNCTITYWRLRNTQLMPRK